MNKPELLAPAGTFECLEAAINHGADAVYIGIGPYNLRAQSPNFSVDMLPEVLGFARERGRNVYAALNTMPSDTQVRAIETLVKSMAAQNVLPDACIVSDPGVIRLCKEYFPSVPLHLSTQTGTFNCRSMQFWAEQGIARIVLPRELTLGQIAALNAAGICKTEVFIHGAMCVSISGRCLLGAYLSGRHANQGECPQPCRFRYAIAPRNEESDEKPSWFPVEEDAGGTYLMNSKDLNTLSILPDIVATGVSSLKIEGRNKSVHYVSATVKTYRAALDLLFDGKGLFRVDQTLIDTLEQLDHRPYTTGFYSGEYSMQETAVSKAPCIIRVVGVVKGVLEGGDVAIVDVKNPFIAGERLNILPVNRKKTAYAITFSGLQDVNGNNVERALTNRLVKLFSQSKLSVGDIIRRIA